MQRWHGSKGYSRLTLAAPHQGDNVAAIAVGFAVSGDRNKTFEYLDKALSNQDDELIFSIRYPTFDSTGSDPRYAELMRHLGLPE